MSTLDLSQYGADQAAILAQLTRRCPLPANAPDFPLAPGQFYGQIATNCRIFNSKAGANKAISARNHHRARGPISELAMVLPNWYVERSASKFEYPNNAGVVCAASVEYPAGVFHRFQFNLAVRELIAGGDYLVSAFVPVDIPDNAEFWTNIWLSAASTILFFNAATGQVATNGERGTVSTTDVTDYTMATHTGTAQSYGVWPLALIGRTAQKPVAILSDSIGEGVGDVADTTDHVGMLARLLGPTLPYINLSQSGDRLELLRQSHSKRFAVLGYARSLVLGLGVNDVGAGRTLPAIQTDMIALWAQAKQHLPPDGRIIQTTLTPSCTSTDSFATIANQTAAPNFSTSGDGTREQLNDWLRDGAPLQGSVPALTGTQTAIRAGTASHPLHGVLDMADAVESARNSGRWRVDGSAFKWTIDGLHPSSFAHKEAASQKTSDLLLFQ
ncbi:SGNH/GDSL hydrolase family protein [Devosia submarina]|uniref:SGNH/GDSL hydrolase family protein n=1 Tax=Devosia submarina TaxID=1173082 RepID=UPI000D395040|nr:SGNH/GDSL hydrolase family protein [Devosia submarina]